MPVKPKLGQNFLHDVQATQRIAASLGDLSGRTVVEIGPGRGAITASLAARAAHVIAVLVGILSPLAFFTMARIILVCVGMEHIAQQNGEPVLSPPGSFREHRPPPRPSRPPARRPRPRASEATD